MIELAREAGIEVREVPLTKHDVYIADECFLTGTAAEVIPVVKVDSRTIGTGKPGPMTRDLEKRFKQADAGMSRAINALSRNRRPDSPDRRTMAAYNRRARRACTICATTYCEPISDAERVLSGMAGELLAVRIIEPGKALVVVYREIDARRRLRHHGIR